MRVHQRALPLDFAPRVMQDHGLSDAHPFPLVSAGKVAGHPFTSRRVSAEAAWDWAEVEYGRTPTSYAAVLVDLDGHDSADRLDGAVLARAVQPPSWAVRRPSSGGVHAAWALAVPVHRYPDARTAPLDLFARISEFYTLELRGDPGFGGVLAHNPESGLFEVRYTHPGGWSLEELADPIPAGWRRPSRQNLVSAAGRNVTLFRSLCGFAGRGLHTDGGRCFYEIDAEAERINNQFASPLGLNEVRDVLRHVYRYREQWWARGHQPAFIERQRHRARAGRGRIFMGPTRASANSEGNNEALRPWDAAGISRRTWYRERAKRRVADRVALMPIPIEGPITMEVTLRDEERYAVLDDIRGRLDGRRHSLAAVVSIWRVEAGIDTPVGELLRGRVPDAFLAAWKTRREELADAAGGQIDEWGA